jgi:osmotically-inducible protein OsmY
MDTMTDEPRKTEESPTQDHPRDLLERAKDEVAAWFGNPEAASRRQQDLAVGDHTGKGPQDDDRNPDERIVDEVGERLTQDSGIDASRIHVTSAAGAVTLAGEVTTSAQRFHAEELTHAVPGVIQVENRLLVA